MSTAGADGFILPDGNLLMNSIPAQDASCPQLVVNGAVATITINRPAHRNRLEDDDLKVLLAHFEQVNADTGIRVLVLTANTQGHKRAVFCAGYHMGNFDSPDADPFFFEQIPQALADLRPVTICALNGSVYGGATDLVLACDLRVALDGIEFRMPATSLGLHYYPSGLQRYVACLGVSGAKRAFLSGRSLSAADLDHFGCLEACVGPETFDETVQALAGQVARLAPLAAELTKRSLNEIAMGKPDTATMHARERLTMASSDFKEGRQAFIEKRLPDFKGL